MGRRFFIVLLVALCFYKVLDAQGFGLYVGTKLSPPFSPYVRDYILTSDKHLNVQLKNMGDKSCRIALRMVLENISGIRLETKQGTVLTTYTLVPGKELLLTGSALEAHFKPENLVFKGLSAADYDKGPLPDGLYKIRFDAYDAATGTLLAAGDAAQAWLVLNKAPSIVLPADNEEFYLGENKRFYFEWSARHDEVSKIQRVEYEFRLVEIPQSFNGQVASIFHTLPVIYERTVTTSSMLVDFTQLTVHKDRRYAFRIRAKAMSGNNEVKCFENDGYSPVSVFTYKGVCPPPVVSTINFPGIHTAEISWSKLPDVTRYTFLIRDAGAKNWERKDLQQPYLKLSTLSYDKTYEYRVRGYCKAYPGAYSDTYTFMLPGERPVMYHSRIRLSENVEIRYNHSDTTVTVSDRTTKDSIRVDVRETVKRSIPVSIADDEGNMFTLTPKRLK